MRIPIETHHYYILERETALETKVEVELFQALAVGKTNAAVNGFETVELDAELLYLRHLVEALRKNLCAVQRRHVLPNEAESGDVLVVHTSLAADLKNLRAIDRVSKLQFLHVDFNAYLREVVDLLLEAKGLVLII